MQFQKCACVGRINSIGIAEINRVIEKCKKKLKLQNMRRIMIACISIMTRKNHSYTEKVKRLSDFIMRKYIFQPAT